MGLVNAPSTYARNNAMLYDSLINKCLILYMYDFNCFTQTEEEQILALAKLFILMEQANLRFNIKKCHFITDRIRYLGFICTKNGLEPDPAKTAKIRKLKRPTTVSDVRSFLGLLQYYRRFIPGFAKLARPLYDQTKVNRPA